MSTRRRLHLLDLIRGITLLSMIAYHGAYDLVYLYGRRIPGYRGTPGYLWQQSICWIFIFLSGFCFPMAHHSRSGEKGDGASTEHASRPGRLPAPFRSAGCKLPAEIKRGLLLTACGLIITGVTLLFMPEATVIMGVLSFYGLAVLLTSFAFPLLKRIPAAAGLSLSILLFLLTRNIPSGSLGFESFSFFPLPNWLYANSFTMVLGFPYPGFTSTDYFSLFPWIFLFWAGFYTWNAFFAASPRAQERLSPSLCTPLQWIGRHTLPIYMLHQPVLMAVFILCEWVGIL